MENLKFIIKLKKKPSNRGQNIIGEKFGKLTVLEDAGFTTTGARKKIFKCICDCGKIVIVKRNSLISGHTKSCGCLEIETKKTNNLKHGLRHHPLYTTWLNIKDRCNNPNNTHYKNYGKRGIKICKDWSDDFKSFYDWAINNGYKEGLSIERLDVNKGYSPDNCSWIPFNEQERNKTTTKLFIYNNKEYTIPELAKLFNKHEQTLYSYYHRHGNLNYYGDIKIKN